LLCCPRGAQALLAQFSGAFLHLSASPSWHYLRESTHQQTAFFLNGLLQGPQDTRLSLALSYRLFRATSSQPCLQRAVLLFKRGSDSQAGTEG
jgi:hypothetical protein